MKAIEFALLCGAALIGCHSDDPKKTDDKGTEKTSEKTASTSSKPAKPTDTVKPTAKPKDVAPDSDPSAATLKRIKDAAHCDESASPSHGWCIAADWSKGVAGDLPASKTLVGITVQIEDGKDVAKTLHDDVTFSALVIDGDGKAMLSYVLPSNADEKKEVTAAVGETTAVLDGKSKDAKIAKGMSDFIKTIKAAYVTTKGASEVTWVGKSPTRARKIGDFWVALEATKTGGTWVTILTESWQ